MNNIIKCDFCGFEYKTKNGLLKHLKNIHKTQELQLDDCLQYNCQYCGKLFKHRQTRWTHEQKCKLKNKNPLTEQIKTLSNEIKELKAKPNIINNTTNIQYIIKQPGTESIEHLSTDKQREIMQKGLNSLTYLIEINNFSKDYPENHTYCVTALNDKHASIINPNTNLIIKTEKTTIFDKMLVSNLTNLEKISQNPNFKLTERKDYEDKIKKLKDLLFLNRRSLKRYYSDLNLISYNNKDIVLETWASLKSIDKILESQTAPKLLGFENLSDDDSPNNSEDEELGKKQEQLKRIFNNKNQIIPTEYESDTSDTGSEDETLSNSETDLEDIKGYVKVIIRNKTYILEDGNKLFNIVNDKRGDYYGILSKGKVSRNKKEINI
jgi:hypothetical protein